MVPVLVECIGGRFQATVFGNSGIQAEGITKDEAMEALKRMLDSRVADAWAKSRAEPARAELLWIDGPKSGGGPTWPPRPEPTPEEIELVREMVAEIYRERDAQKAAEFPG
jgi:hypothetical protein